MARADVFSDEKIASPAFTSNAKKMLSLDREVLFRLRQNLPLVPDQLVNDRLVEERAAVVGISDKEYRSLSSFSRMILTSVQTDSLNSDDVVDIFKKACGSVEGREDDIREYFALSEEEKDASENISAFYFANTIHFAEFKPLITTEGGRPKSRLEFGGCLTINYLDPSGAAKAVSVNLGIHELKELAEVISQGIHLLEELRTRF